MKEALKLSYFVGLVIGSLVFMTLFFFGQTFIEWFIKEDPQIIHLATQGAKLYSIAFFMNGFNIINSGYFTFIGEALKSVLIASSRGFICIVLGIICLPKLLGLNGIWLTIPFAEFVTVILGILLLRKKVSN